MQQCMCETKIRDIDDLHRRMSKTWFDFEQDIIDTAIDRWRDGLRSCESAGSGHFEHIIWNERSFIWFIRTFYETVNAMWCIARLFCS